MHLINLEGKEIKLNLKKTPRPTCSEPHRKTRDILKKIFPNFHIYEEVYVDEVYLDFLIPLLKLVIEVDGIQHDKYVEFFHQNGTGFLKSIQRDERKNTLCEINGFKMIRIPEAKAGNKEHLIEELYGRVNPESH